LTSTYCSGTGYPSFVELDHLLAHPTTPRGAPTKHLHRLLRRPFAFLKPEASDLKEWQQLALLPMRLAPKLGPPAFCRTEQGARSGQGSNLLLVQARSPSRWTTALIYRAYQFVARHHPPTTTGTTTTPWTPMVAKCHGQRVRGGVGHRACQILLSGAERALVLRHLAMGGQSIRCRWDAWDSRGWPLPLSSKRDVNSKTLRGGHGAWLGHCLHNPAPDLGSGCHHNQCPTMNTTLRLGVGHPLKACQA